MEDKLYANYDQYLAAFYAEYFMTRYLALPERYVDIYITGEDNSIEVAVQKMIETYHPDFLTVPKPLIIIGV